MVLCGGKEENGGNHTGTHVALLSRCGALCFASGSLDSTFLLHLRFTVSEGRFGNAFRMTSNVQDDPNQHLLILTLTPSS